MSAHLAIGLDDRALAIASGGALLASEPAAVADGSGSRPAGAAAWDAARREPTAVSTRHLQDLVTSAAPSDRSLALVRAELARLLAAADIAAGAPAWLLAPAGASPAALGNVLGVVGSLGPAVLGFVDAAVVTAAVLGLRDTVIVIEPGLHRIGATALECGSQVRHRRTLATEAGGIIELCEAWLDLVSAAMVRRSRFDPLHDAATEQQLFDALPAVAAEAAARGSAVARVSAGGERFDIELSRDQFAAGGARLFREVARLVHELRPAGAPVTIVVPRAFAGLPGASEALDAFAGCELVAVDEGFAAAAASLLDLPAPAAASGDSVRLLRRLPAASVPELVRRASRRSLGRERGASPAASHVLYGGQAFALARVPVVVGRGLAAGANAIALPEGLAGVSRRHCTFLRDGPDVVLVDHSRFGTFVNGERVAERVPVHAGDRVRLGEPGVELALIAVDGGAAEGGREGAHAQAPHD